MGLSSSFFSCQFEIFRALASLPNLYTQYGNTGSIWEGKLWIKETENASVFLGTCSKFSEKNKSLKDMHWGWTANRRWEMTCPKMWLQQLGEQNTGILHQQRNRVWSWSGSNLLTPSHVLVPESLFGLMLEREGRDMCSSSIIHFFIQT